METNNIITLWEEKNLIEQEKNCSNNTNVGQKDIITNIRTKLEKKECKNTGNKKTWKKICPNCNKEVFYSSEEQLKRSISNNRSCLSCGSFKIDRYLGMKFGDITIIKQYNSISPCGSKIIKVDYKCKCGNITTNKRFGCVKRQKMCIICRKKNEYKIKNPGKSAFNCVYNDYKNGAEKRHYEFKLTKKDFEMLTKKNCYYCGDVPKNIKKARKNKEIYVYNGIDRVDNNKGYLIENCVPCCRICNSFKTNMSINNFLNHIQKIYEHKKLKD